MLVEMIGSQPKQNAVTALLLTRSLMLKYEWRVSFATEGGVKAILCCMQEYPACIQVQQIALAVSEDSCDLYILCLQGHIVYRSSLFNIWLACHYGNGFRKSLRMTRRQVAEVYIQGGGTS